METIENNSAEKCIAINGFENLNKEGCQFFVDADSITETLMTSTELRWLSP